MQIKFLTTLLLVGICFVQVIFAHPHEIAAQQNLNDDLIAQAIKEVQSVIREKVRDASKDFDKFKDLIYQLGIVAIEEPSEKLSETIASSKKQINEIKHKAEEDGEDIFICLIGVDDRLDEIDLSYYQNQISCITEEVEEAKRIINEAVQIAEDAWSSVEDLPEKLQACGREMTRFVCINKVIMNVTKLQVDMVGEITQKIIELSSFVLGLQNSVGICADSYVEDAAFEAVKVVVDLDECVADETEY